MIQPTGASVDDLRPASCEFYALVNAGISKANLTFILHEIRTPTVKIEPRSYIAEAGDECPEVAPTKSASRRLLFTREPLAD